MTTTSNPFNALALNARIDELNDLNDPTVQSWSREEWIAAHNEATKKWSDHLRSISTEAGLGLDDEQFEKLYSEAYVLERRVSRLSKYPHFGSSAEGIEHFFIELVASRSGN